MHHQEFCPDFKCECVKIVEIARIPKTKSLGIPKHRNEVTLHDINFESVSKSLWKWAMSGRIHEETTELKKELPLGSARFGTEGVVAQLQTNLKTHKPSGQVKPNTIQSATRNLLVPCGEVCCLGNLNLNEYYRWNGTSSTQLKSSMGEPRNWCLDRMAGSSPQMSKTSLWWVSTSSLRRWLLPSGLRRTEIS